MKIPLIYLKDKQFFVKKEGTMRLLGRPVETAKKLKEQGYILLHIVDLDAKTETNFDVYDKLTYFINIQVECGKNENLIKRLLDVNARVVVDLPTEINLEKYKEKRRLLVGRIGKNYQGNAENVYDVILAKPSSDLFSKFRNKRLIVYEDYKGKEKVWGIISSLK